MPTSIKHAADCRSKKSPYARHHDLEPKVAVQRSEQPHGSAEHDEEDEDGFSHSNESPALKNTPRVASDSEPACRRGPGDRRSGSSGRNCTAGLCGQRTFCLQDQFLCAKVHLRLVVRA